MLFPDVFLIFPQTLHIFSNLLLNFRVYVALSPHPNVMACIAFDRGFYGSCNNFDLWDICVQLMYSWVFSLGKLGKLSN